ncbi:MAG: sugar transferase [Isosphaeraceae bacterium]
MLKRVFDVAASTVALGLSAPLLVSVYLAVRLGSPGPGLFRQTRVGHEGRDFLLYKFRTMTVRPGAESGSFDAGDGRRVTRVGRVLRASKIDELPQFWNVLRGDMSVVGPRPEVRKWVECYPDRWAFVHQVKPGMTDPAAIVYRDEERLLAAEDDPEAAYRDRILPHKLSLYEDYVRRQSFLGDLVILGRTLLAVAIPSRSRPEGPR